MPKVFTSENQKIGKLGEDIAVRFLVSKGFCILERNYTKKFGELDIVAKKSDKIHFIEVKSISRESKSNANNDKKSVTHETYIRPEENMHPKKLERLYRTIHNYLSFKGQMETDWQLDLICVYLYVAEKSAKIKVLENIVQ